MNEDIMSKSNADYYLQCPGISSFSCHHVAMKSNFLGGWDVENLLVVFTLPESVWSLMFHSKDNGEAHVLIKEHQSELHAELSPCLKL